MCPRTQMVRWCAHYLEVGYGLDLGHSSEHDLSLRKSLIKANVREALARRKTSDQPEKRSGPNCQRVSATVAANCRGSDSFQDSLARTDMGLAIQGSIAHAVWRVQDLVLWTGFRKTSVYKPLRISMYHVQFGRGRSVVLLDAMNTLQKLDSNSLDNPLISALVERWRRETNTFHLTVGEMTVTLEDVAYLLGLPVDGEPVIGVTYTSCEAVCLKYLGKAPNSGYNTSGCMVKLSWLKETFSFCPADASLEDIEHHTRAYLLYLVGSTIFSTTTGNKVPVMYLPLFENFDEAGKWKGKQSSPTSNRDVAFYRKSLDLLKPSDVDWCPYSNISHTVVPENILNTLILGRSKTMLICFDKAERHLPDRVLRQFGMNQTIPQEVQRWERKSRGVDGGVDLSAKMESELNEWSNRHLHVVEAEEYVKESAYMQWYWNITRRLVGRPIPISSEFQRMNAALRDIAHLADTLSTHGMDDQQIQVVTRIRDTAHECLRDQVGSSLVIVANSPNEVGKRGRGKERIRRKGMSKRKRREEVEQYYAADGMNPQSYFSATVIEADHAHLYPAGSEVDDPHLYITANEGDDGEMGDVGGGHRVDDVEICNEGDDINDSSFHHAAEEEDDELAHGIADADGGSHGNGSIEIVSQTLPSSKDVVHPNDCSVII
nr:serine/threonine-protein phosphatase 7 long form homolog [Ipomoea batatas]